MSELNLVQARHNMVEQQIRPWEVLDPDVLDLMEQMPRDEFVPEAYRNLAYSDLQIPLGRDQVMMAPKVEARILQSMDIQPHDRVLEVGTGSGWFTALLASRAAHVHSVEYIPEFKVEAARRLADHDVHNVTLEVGDAATGWPRHAPYDVIVVTGSLPIVPDGFREELTEGGRLFVIEGEDPVMEAEVITRLDGENYLTERLFETSLPALINAPEPDRFQF
ncbi:protein-L-isoaspartate O-methyltransferase family protein [Thiohalospira sp.]|uniref:protein-L-isoaspartate O-methyltransferase family protein n=1 Tax=Thiohalospira sp. TaxID=3080549 RepID=UPI0039805F07